jgi:hypothetical protein
MRFNRDTRISFLVLSPNLPRAKKRRCLIGIAKFREETSKKQRAEAHCIDKLRAPKAGRKHFFALQHAVKFPVFPR